MTNNIVRCVIRFALTSRERIECNMPNRIRLPTIISTSLLRMTGTLQVKWFDPRNSGALQDGTITSVQRGVVVSIGSPPKQRIQAANRHWTAPWALLSALVFCIIACECNADAPDAKPHGKDHSSSIHSHPNAERIRISDRYLQAVKNARNATAENVSRDLTAIVRSSGELVWREEGDKRQVLVATWTSHKTYYPMPGTLFTEKYPVWVTVAPALRDFCVAYQSRDNGVPLPRRIEQLLGLPPNSGHKFVVELWVDPSDLFRPSADPEITDHEAQLQFPDVRGCVSVSEPFKQWYPPVHARSL